MNLTEQEILDCLTERERWLVEELAEGKSLSDIARVHSMQRLLENGHCRYDSTRARLRHMIQSIQKKVTAQSRFKKAREEYDTV